MRRAQYLLTRNLLRSCSRKMRVVDEKWLHPSFPRFYHYGILRELDLVTRWAQEPGNILPLFQVAEAALILHRSLNSAGRMENAARDWKAEGTLVPIGEDQWQRSARADTFALLDLISRPGPSFYLTRQWYATVKRLAQLFAIAP